MRESTLNRLSMYLGLKGSDQVNPRRSSQHLFGAKSLLSRHKEPVTIMLHSCVETTFLPSFRTHDLLDLLIGFLALFPWNHEFNPAVQQIIDSNVCYTTLCSLEKAICNKSPQSREPARQILVARWSLLTEPAPLALPLQLKVQ